MKERGSEHSTDCVVHLLVEFELFAQRLVLVLQIDAEQGLRFELPFQCRNLLLEIVVQFLQGLNRNE